MTEIKRLECATCAVGIASGVGAGAFCPFVDRQRRAGELLYLEGFRSAQEVADMPAEELEGIDGIDAEMAERILSGAKKVAEEVANAPAAEDGEAQAEESAGHEEQEHVVDLSERDVDEEEDRREPPDTLGRREEESDGTA